MRGNQAHVCAGKFSRTRNCRAAVGSGGEFRARGGIRVDLFGYGQRDGRGGALVRAEWFCAVRPVQRESAGGDFYAETFENGPLSAAREDVALYSSLRSRKLPSRYML